jgi:hypothetical protein
LLFNATLGRAGPGKLVKERVLVLLAHLLPLLDLDDNQVIALETAGEYLVLEALKAKPLTSAGINLVGTLQYEQLVDVHEAEVGAEGFSHTGVLLEGRPELEQFTSDVGLNFMIAVLVKLSILFLA